MIGFYIVKKEQNKNASPVIPAKAGIQLPIRESSAPAFCE